MKRNELLKYLRAMDAIFSGKAENIHGGITLP
jgi:hypothetical protein